MTPDTINKAVKDWQWLQGRRAQCAVLEYYTLRRKYASRVLKHDITLRRYVQACLTFNGRAVHTMKGIE